MKKDGPITSLNMEDLIADTGWAKPVNNFHVFKSAEFKKDKRISSPVRLDHFVIILAVEGTAQIRINLTDHFIERNGLIILAPNLIHESLTDTDIDLHSLGVH